MENLLPSHPDFYIEIKRKVIARIHELKVSDGRYKNDTEMLMLVCSIIERIVEKRDKLSKKDLALDVLDELFSLSDEDKANLSNNIDFLWKNRMFKIKKESIYKFVKSRLFELLGIKK